VFDAGLLVPRPPDQPVTDPRCGTPLSDAELGQPDVYQIISDPAVTVRFRLRTLPRGAPRELEGPTLLVWTTTHGRLSRTPRGGAPGRHLRGGPQVADGDRVVVADGLFARVLGDGWHVAARSRGQALVGASYQRPFGLIEIPTLTSWFQGSFVTTEDGPGSSTWRRLSAPTI